METIVHETATILCTGLEFGPRRLQLVKRQNWRLFEELEELDEIKWFEKHRAYATNFVQCCVIYVLLSTIVEMEHML